MCLGLKDTGFWLNVPFEELEQIKPTELTFVDCPYAVVHHIIYGGIEFAEDYGFGTPKDFAVTRYLLEEDDDQTELIEIDFGYGGMPYYSPDPFEDPVKVRRVLATLERTAGQGNYVFDPFDSDHDEDDWESDEDAQKNFDEVLKTIDEAYREFVKGKRGRPRKRMMIGKSYILTDDRIDTVYNQFSSKKQLTEYMKLREMVLDRQQPEKAIPKLLKAVADYPDQPVFANILQSAYVLTGQKERSEQVVRELYERFPGYLFAMVTYANMLLDKGAIAEAASVIKGRLDLDQLYPDRNTFHVTEAAVFYACMCRYFTAIDDIATADEYMQVIFKEGLRNMPGQSSVELAIEELYDAKVAKIKLMASRSSHDLLS